MHVCMYVCTVCMHIWVGVGVGVGLGDWGEGGERNRGEGLEYVPLSTYGV